MKEIKVVIGKNFGDEGKGQTVSDLCRGRSALVVRHNGGAQAGHTVEEGNFRFVFHQLGSGSLWGCPTYWSHTFLPDLLKLGEEAEDFERAAGEWEGSVFCAYPARAAVLAHPDCACTVIYDVLLNSLVEQLRGDERHGSCGMGIYEAVLRSRKPEYGLFLREFDGYEALGSFEAFVGRIAGKLYRIRQGSTLPRLRELRGQYGDRWQQPGIQEWVSLIEDDNVLQNAAEEMCENYRKYVRLAELDFLWPQYDRIVFENAQGLMLDEDNAEYYPHLTPSHTGLYNVARLLEGMPEDSRQGTMEIVYVTRTYVTRHGAGRLDHECGKEDINPQMEDRTNLPNPWQSSLRFARHPSGDLFFRYILADLEQLTGLEQPDPRFAAEGRRRSVVLRLTHLDETEGMVLFENGDMDAEALADLCSDRGITLARG